MIILRESIGNNKNEKNLSTKQISKKKETRLPFSDEHYWRQEDYQQKKKDWKKKTHGIIANQNTANQPIPAFCFMKTRSEYVYVASKGKVFFSSMFVVQFIKDYDVDSFKFGITVSRKVGNSVTRNLMRRRIKDALRRVFLERFCSYGVSCVFICRRKIVTKDFSDILRECASCRLRLIQKV